MKAGITYMSKSYLDTLKRYLEDGYIIDNVLLSGMKTEKPALLIHMVGTACITLPLCQYSQIPEVKDFIKRNYPDVLFIER
jgi:hypothetical protein